MKVHELNIAKTARYYTLGELNERTRQIWFVLHGYAQLAAGFIEAFEPLTAKGIYIVAPEATHRFYAKGFSGNVGATWMTKEARELDIKDNIAYLNKMASQILGSHTQHCKIVLLGFSQGVATVTRWFVNTNFKTDALIIYAGEIAAELRTNPLPAPFTQTKNYFVYGTADPFLPSFAPDTLKPFVDNNLLEQITFSGGHEINAEVLAKVAEGI